MKCLIRRIALYQLTSYELSFDERPYTAAENGSRALRDDTGLGCAYRPPFIADAQVVTCAQDLTQATREIKSRRKINLIINFKKRKKENSLLLHGHEELNVRGNHADTKKLNVRGNQAG